MALSPLSNITQPHAREKSLLVPPDGAWAIHIDPHGFVGHFAPTSGNMIDRELRLKVLAGIPEARVEDGRWGCPFPCGCLPSA